MLCDTTKKPFLAYLIQEKRLLGTVEIAAPIWRDVWFLEENGGLYCKRFIRTSRLTKIEGGAAGTAVWEPVVTKVFTFSLGKKKLINVTSLPKHGLLLECVEANNKEWMLINPSKLSAEMATKGDNK